MMGSENAELLTLEFRNGLYQGRTANSEPKGIGILLDDFMRFYVSEWQ